MDSISLLRRFATVCLSVAVVFTIGSASAAVGGRNVRIADLQWDASGELVSADLVFGAGSPTKECELCFAYGLSDGSLPDAEWDHIDKIADFERSDATSYHVANLPAGYGTAYTHFRFLLKTKGYTTFDYRAQDKLVAHFDAIENSARGVHSATQGDWTDLTGKGHSATKVGSPAWVEKACRLTRNSNNYYSIGNVASLLAEMGDTWTVEVTATPTANWNYNYSGIAGNHGKGMHGLIFGQVGDGIASFAINDQCNPTRVVSPRGFYTLNLATADYVKLSTFTAVDSPTTGSFWMNGGLCGNVFTNGAAVNSSLIMTAFYIGRAYNSNERNFDGDIHSVRIYHGILSAEEIADNHAIDTVRFLSSEEPDVVSVSDDASTRWFEVTADPIPAQVHEEGVASRPSVTLRGRRGTADCVVIPPAEYAVEYADNDRLGRATVTVTSANFSAPVSISFAVGLAEKPATEDFPRLGSAAYDNGHLFAQFDAIENAGRGQHSNTTTTWANLMNAADSAVYNSGTPAWSATAVTMTRNSHKYFTVDDNFQSRFGNTWTVQALVKPGSNYNQNYAGICGNHGDSGKMGLSFGQYSSNNDSFGFNTYNPSGGGASAGGNIPMKQIADGDPHLITLTMTPTYAWLYFDNNLFSENDLAAANRPLASTLTADPFYIGRANNSTDRDFPGQIYSIRVYSSVLSPAEVARTRALDNERFFNASAATLQATQATRSDTTITVNLQRSLADCPSRATCCWGACYNGADLEAWRADGGVTESDDFVFEEWSDVATGTMAIPAGARFVRFCVDGVWSSTLEIATLPRDVQPETDFVIDGSPRQRLADVVAYGACEVKAGDVLAVPAESKTGRNAKLVCVGHRFYRYEGGDYVEVPERGGESNSFTVEQGDVGTGAKLVWLWEDQDILSAHSYANKGLIAQWDAIDNLGTGVHDPTAKTWVDLTGNCADLANEGLAFEKGNCAVLPAGVAMKTMCPAMPEMPVGGTIEALCFASEFVSHANVSTILATGQNLGFGWRDSTMPVFEFGHSYDAETGTGRVHWWANISAPSVSAQLPASTEATRTLSQNGTGGWKFYVDGTSLTGGNNYYDDTVYRPMNSNIVVGTTYGSVFKARSLRVYSRELSAHEVNYNRAVDTVRYGLADADETLDELGYKPNANGDLAYRLEVASSPAGRVDIRIDKDDAIAVTTGSTVFWVTNGANVQVSFVPTEAGVRRFISGAPVNSDYPTANSVRFTMPNRKFGLTPVEYPYDDGYLTCLDGSVRCERPYGDARRVYVFTNAAAGRFPVFVLNTLTYQESLVVAGGGGGSHGSGGGGGGAGGLLRDATVQKISAGRTFTVKVGAGGAYGVPGGAWATNGGQTEFLLGGVSLLPIGGGRGNCGNNPGADGGSGGGGNGTYHGGFGTEGQGFDGVWGSGYSSGGGGGGAREVGGYPKNIVEGVGYAGKGGDGLWDRITGENCCYGSGGGGAATSSHFDGEGGFTDPPGEGGAYSGGRGGVSVLPEPNPKGYTINGQDGKDGFGGGGGAVGNNSANYHSGRGGCGTVVVAFNVGDTVARQFAVDTPAAFPITEGEACPEPTVRIDGRQLVRDADYELYYENNTRIGEAKLVVKGIGDYADVVMRVPFQVSGVRYVKPAATGAGDGSDWTNAMTLAAAVSGLSSQTYDIWCAAGDYVFDPDAPVMTLSKAVTVRGGFAADPTDISRKADAGAQTVFDGALAAQTAFSGTYATLASAFGTAAVKFVDCTFARFRNSVFKKTNASTLAFENCDFINNVKTNAENSAIVLKVENNSARGASGASISGPIVFKGCRFLGNYRQYNVGGNLIHVTYADLQLEDCLFVTNGVPFTTPAINGNQSTAGLVYQNGGNLTIRDCQFRANAFAGRSSDFSVVSFIGHDLLIEHTVFVGNEMIRTDASGANFGAVFLLQHDSTGVVTARNCTFAYNILDRKQCALLWRRTDKVNVGDLRVSNCIFWQNRYSEINELRYDVYFDSGHGEISYSSFPSVESGKTFSGAVGKGVIAANPRFKGEKLAEGIVKTGNDGSLLFDSARVADLIALDVHLGILSPCINTGDPESDWSKEPKPNGKRINMGAYGGTTEATCTPPGTAVRVK